jgi:hypothetical protein
MFLLRGRKHCHNHLPPPRKPLAFTRHHGFQVLHRPHLGLLIWSTGQILHELPILRGLRAKKGSATGPGCVQTAPHPGQHRICGSGLCGSGLCMESSEGYNSPSVSLALLGSEHSLPAFCATTHFLSYTFTPATEPWSKWALNLERSSDHAAGAGCDQRPHKPWVSVAMIVLLSTKELVLQGLAYTGPGGENNNSRWPSPQMSTTCVLIPLTQLTPVDCRDFPVTNPSRQRGQYLWL